MREVVIDAPSSTFAATREFWAAALLAEARAVPDFVGFTALAEPASMSWVGLQGVGEGAVRFYLDIEAHDVEAKVARLTGPGAAVWR